MLILLCSMLSAFLLALAGRLLAETFLTERIPLLGAFVGLSPTENAGVAFGVTFFPLLQYILIGGALVLVAFLAYRSRQEKVSSIAFGLIIGGALGNIVDRLDDGFVTDFFQVGSFPTFNVADSCIMVGVGMLVLWEVWRGKQQGVEKV